MFDKIITPIVTPFHRDAQQSVNYEATGKLIDHLISGGVNGIFIFGSNGEFHVIEEQEKYDLTKYVVGAYGGKVPVYVGTGACATREAVRNVSENGGSGSRCSVSNRSVLYETI